MLFLLVACQDQNLSTLSDAEIGILPIIEVSPSALAFGEYTDPAIVRNITIIKYWGSHLGYFIHCDRGR